MATTPSSDQRRWAWLDWVVRVGSSEASITSPQAVPLASLRRPASFLSTAIPLTMVIVGLAVAVPSAVWAERSSSEGLGTLGVEAGAALWFGGAVALGVRRTTTVRRGLVIVMTGAIGAALIVLALSFGWSGAVLALAMEFGVGALAIVVIDVIVIGAIQPGLESLARQADSASVDLQFGWRWPPVAMRVHRTPLITDRVDGARR